jgi:hypothetical protein
VKDKSAQRRISGALELLKTAFKRIDALENRVADIEEERFDDDLDSFGPEYALDTSALVNIAIGRKVPLLFEYEREAAKREPGEEPQLRIASLYERRRNGNGSETLIGFDHVRDHIRQYRVDRVIAGSLRFGAPAAYVPPVVEPPVGHETDYAPGPVDVRQRPDETIAEAKAKTDSWLDEPRAVRDNPQG